MAPISDRQQVDELILDYLLWYCAETLIYEHSLLLDEGPQDCIQSALTKSDSVIKMTYLFYADFLRAHSIPTPLTIRRRLKLCRFVCSYFRRLDITDLPSVFARKPGEAAPHITARAITWLRRRGQTSVFPPGTTIPSFTPSTTEPRNTAREEVLFGRNLRKRHINGTLTLRDALFEFMLLSAFESALDAEVNEQWIELAVQFMLHAVLEAYHPSSESSPNHGVEIVNECFSYGFMPLIIPITDNGDDDTETTPQEIILNDMYGGLSSTSSVSIGEILETRRNAVLSELIPPYGGDGDTHLRKLVEKYPRDEFEKMLMEFLIGVRGNQDRPVLAQLEGNRLAGYSDEEVKGLLTALGMVTEVEG
ncbi:hypothetical protein EX30DRAFT_364667 [Ascodesmis nigricans]|uniref:Uncharacterized protein n=1 Tax=Ascodesmis nigricans TaxID=341454 RepID=A0A4S2MUF5_9PEZI|nr:hypothetical protein EX30DRAFT_364667 [Ascodesmis nigricans]